MDEFLILQAMYNVIARSSSIDCDLYFLCVSSLGVTAVFM